MLPALKYLSVSQPETGRSQFQCNAQTRCFLTVSFSNWLQIKLLLQVCKVHGVCGCTEICDCCCNNKQALAATTEYPDCSCGYFGLIVQQPHIINKLINKYIFSSTIPRWASSTRSHQFMSTRTWLTYVDYILSLTHSCVSGTRYFKVFLVAPDTSHCRRRVGPCPPPPTPQQPHHPTSPVRQR